jgi:hypothetical protein
MELGPYYIDLNRCLGEDFSEYEFNADGIPLVRFHRKQDWQHNPVTVCQYGLHHFNRYLKTQEEESRQIFLTQANWLVDHSQKGINGSLVWLYQFDIPFYQISAPWISGMAQGQAMSLLLRAHQVTGESKYWDTAHGAWLISKILIDEGGVLSYFSDGKPVIEEYPSPKFLTGVLNGFIFAIFGVYDYASYTDDKSAHEFYLSLVDSLKANLFRYDCGYWSYYDLKPPLRLSSKSYHRLHLEQLNQMYQLTGEEIFKTVRDRWRSYLFSSRCLMKWTLRKIHQKVLVRV